MACETFFKRSNGMAVMANFITSKSSCTRFLKNSPTEFHEIWYVSSNGHGEYLYIFLGVDELQLFKFEGDRKLKISEIAVFQYFNCVAS